jgi:hypothetical protein
VSSFLASTPDRSHLCLSEESSLHDVPHVTSLGSTQGPTDAPPSCPRPTLIRSLFSARLGTVDIHISPTVLPAIQQYYHFAIQCRSQNGALHLIMMFPGPSAQQAVPASPHSPSALPVSGAGQVDSVPGFVPSTSETSMPLMPPQGTAVSHQNIAPNDGTFYTHCNSRITGLSNHVETLQRSDELVMYIADIATNLSCHPPGTTLLS